MGLVVGLQRYVVKRVLAKVERNTQIVVKTETQLFTFDSVPNLLDALFKWKETCYNRSNRDFEFRFTYKLYRYSIVP